MANITGGIMSFFSKLFLGGKAAETVSTTIQDSAKSTFDLIDNAFYTDQEKAQAKGDALKMYVDLIKSQTQETTGTSEARRWFLQQITNFMMTMAVCTIVAEVYHREDIATIILKVVSDFQFGWAFTGAVGFYFLTHVAAAVMGGKGK